MNEKFKRGPLRPDDGVASIVEDFLPTLDMWMREKRQNNMVVNDPKGELLVKNYVRATVRGMQVVQFNLINAMKTDIYNRAPRSIMKSYSFV